MPPYKVYCSIFPFPQNIQIAPTLAGVRSIAPQLGHLLVISDTSFLRLFCLISPTDKETDISQRVREWGINMFNPAYPTYLVGFWREHKTPTVSYHFPFFLDSLILSKKIPISQPNDIPLQKTNCNKETSFTSIITSHLEPLLSHFTNRQDIQHGRNR